MARSRSARASRTRTGGPQPRPASGPVTLLVGTRKGAFLLHTDRTRRSWRLQGPLFLGHIIHHMVMDPRDARTIVMAARTGHLGPTILRSGDRGNTWQEAKAPPAFPKAAPNETGLVVDHTFWLTPGHPSEPGVWYAGTSPPGLFQSRDGGDTWVGIDGFNEHPQRSSWVPAEEEGPPGGATLHSIQVDPRDPRHLYIGLSMGGVFESRDGGKEWTPLNRGCAADFLPTPDAEYGHDPHCVQLHPARPDRLYQQNHCGIYRMDRGGGSAADRWVRIGDNMPKAVGDIGFPIVLHPRDPDTAWVFPMDGTTVWPRVSPGGKPATYVTRDAGTSWTRQDRGFPKRQAWWTVKRQALATDTHEPVGLYLGTTSGEIWASRTGGTSWVCIARHLQEIYSVEAAVSAR